jgi:hypothetical protein
MSRREFTGPNSDVMNDLTESAQRAEARNQPELAQIYRDARWRLWDGQDLRTTLDSVRDYWRASQQEKLS